ncbi:hypothetical protein ACFP2H_00380 [Mycolicibacterium llatzerense]
MRGNHMGVVASGAAVAVLLASCGTDQSATSKGGSKVPVPAYQLEIGQKPGSLRVSVDQLHTLPEMTEIVADLQRRYSDRPDGYFVQINCSLGGTATVDNRLANAKFAVGRIGAARTGLDDGAREVSMVEDRKCPPDPLPTASASAVTARQVVDSIIAAGLPARKPRDNSQSNCRDLGCVQLITTEDVSVYQFPDAGPAVRMASTSIVTTYQNGPIVLVFHNTESPDPRYRGVLDQLMTR